MHKKFSKEELEDTINKDAVLYFYASADEKVPLRRKLLENIFLYCRDYLLHLQSFIPKNEKNSTEYKETNFHFSVEIAEWFNDNIDDFIPTEGKFVHRLNAAISKRLKKSKRIFIYNEDKTLINGYINNEYIIKQITKLKKIISILKSSGKMEPGCILLSSEHYNFISEVTGWSFKKIRRIYQYAFSENTVTDNKEFKDENTDVILDYLFKENKDDILKLFKNIEQIFNKENKEKKSKLRRLLTLHFIKKIPKYYDITHFFDYTFIDKKYAEELLDNYEQTGKYPTFTDLKKEIEHTNPTLLLTRFSDQVEEETGIRIYHRQGEV